jgi:ArsR family metal-binding transcriptional regulator
MLFMIKNVLIGAVLTVGLVGLGKEQFDKMKKRNLDKKQEKEEIKELKDKIDEALDKRKSKRTVKKKDEEKVSVMDEVQEVLKKPSTEADLKAVIEELRKNEK